MCNYCRHKYANNVLFTGKEDSYGFEVVIYKHLKPVISIVVNNLTEIVINIKYCPMCGKELNND